MRQSGAAVQLGERTGAAERWEWVGLRWTSRPRALPLDLLVRYRRPIVVAVHLLLIPAGFLFAFLLRFDFTLPQTHRGAFLAALPLLLGVRFAAFAAFGLFQGWWRHTGMRDLIDLVRAVTLSSAVLICLLFLLQELDGLPRSILVLDWVVAIALFGGLRFGVRAVREDLVRLRSDRPGKRTLVIGAGNAAERLLRECQRSADPEYWPIALIDDDAQKTGMRIHGVPVLGTTADLARIATRVRAQVLVIAIPSARREEMRAIVDACLATGLDFKIVPPLREVLDGRTRMSQLRGVEIEDLLGRDAVQLEMDAPRADLRGRVVLVTGGAGSVGSELARQIARFEPRRLVLLDQAESPLYFTHLELAKAHPGLPVVPVIADVTDQARMEAIFSHFRPEYVFHAAAYKHVPLMESNTVEAVRNNVLGTLFVARCAARYAAEKFVLISTDKAVYPSSVMGATKRLAEQIVLGVPDLRESETDFRAVRFGNVLGSEGSVIPLFKRQMAAGQALTVTHPEVTRYFMTIPEAVQLVLHASALEEAAGRILMLDMGQAVRITDLAEQLVRLSGLEPHVDVPIVYTGLRPGEKLHEDLTSELEATVPTSIAKVRIVETNEPDPAALIEGLDCIARSVAIGSQQESIAAMCRLVPEAVSPLRERGAEAALHA